MNYNYLLVSDDAVSLDKEINSIITKNNFLDNYIGSYDLEEINLSNALEDLDTYSFLSNKKVIIIKNVFNDSNDKNLDHLLKYLDNYNSDNLLILTTRKIDNRLNIVKKIKKNSNIKLIQIEIDPYKYVKEILTSYKIDNSSINLLIELCKSDITRLSNECNKLMMYKLEEKEITKDDILEIVVKKLGDSNELLFSLIKYIILKDKKQALTIYDELKQYNVDVNSIIGLMASQIRLTHQIKILAEDNLSNQQIADSLHLKSTYQVKKIKEYIYNYTYDEIYEFVHHLADVDFAIKSGRMSTDSAIEMLIINL